MILSDFPIAVHTDTQILDEQVLRWAGTWLHKSDNKSAWEIIEQCSVRKLNWFACYLFPEMESSRVKRVAKLFFCLFILDDMLDELEEVQVEGFLSDISSDKLTPDKSVMSCLGFPIDLCYFRILECFTGEWWKEEFERIWNSYIAGLQWERQNKKREVRPSLVDYQKMRPHSSGVYIAIHLLFGDNMDHTCDCKELECDIARYIYLSNDLVSAAKEKAIGDLHNEVLLLSLEYGMEVAEKIVEGELSYLLKKIKTMGSLLSETSEECKVWVDSLFLLVGGCQFWSWESERYTEYSGRPN